MDQTQGAASPRPILQSTPPRTGGWRGPGDQALSQLWRDAFEAAERHIKGLRVGELAAFRLRDFVVERVSIPEQPQAQAQLPASSSTTTTSPSAEGD